MKQKLLAMALALVATLPVGAANWVENDMINGVNLYITNNTTVRYTNTAIWFVSKQSLTNVQSRTTNPSNTNLTNPQHIIDGQIWADEMGRVSDNISFFIEVGTTNRIPFPNQTLSSSPWPAPLFTNSVLSTNLVTVTLAAVRNVDNEPDDTGNFSFTFLGTGTGGTYGAIPFVTSTNLPNSFIAGAKQIRLVSITVNSVADSQGIVVNRAGIVGWNP